VNSNPTGVEGDRADGSRPLVVQSADVPPPGGFPTRSFTVDSEHTGRCYEVTVEVPNRYHRSNRTYPLVVVLDGQWVFGVVRDAFRIMTLHQELPEVVLVGVAHANPDVRRIVQERAIDFTPTPATAPAATGVRLPAEEVGQAHAFRRALVEEIMAPVVASHRVSDDHTLVGHSFSALFALDTLLTTPTMFNRWVLASPSVWWDNRVMFRREAEHAALTDDLKARVFMSAGSDEGSEEGFGGHRDIHDQLADRNYANLNLTWAEFADETHSSVVAPAVSRGLRSVFS